MNDGYEVRDARGQRLCWIQAHRSDFVARNIGVLTIDEARRFAIWISRIPDMRRGLYVPAARLREYFPVVIEVAREVGPPQEIALLNEGRLGLGVFEAFVRCLPGRTLVLSTGNHRLALHPVMEVDWTRLKRAHKAGSDPQPALNLPAKNRAKRSDSKLLILMTALGKAIL